MGRRKQQQPQQQQQQKQSFSLHMNQLRASTRRRLAELYRNAPQGQQMTHLLKRYATADLLEGQMYARCKLAAGGFSFRMYRQVLERIEAGVMGHNHSQLPLCPQQPSQPTQQQSQPSQQQSQPTQQQSQPTQQQSQHTQQQTQPSQQQTQTPQRQTQPLSSYQQQQVQRMSTLNRQYGNSLRRRMEAPSTPPDYVPKLRKICEILERPEIFVLSKRDPNTLDPAISQLENILRSTPSLPQRQHSTLPTETQPSAASTDAPFPEAAQPAPNDSSAARRVGEALLQVIESVRQSPACDAAWSRFATEVDNALVNGNGNDNNNNNNATGATVSSLFGNNFAVGLAATARPPTPASEDDEKVDIKALATVVMPYRSAAVTTLQSEIDELAPYWRIRLVGVGGAAGETTVDGVVLQMEDGQEEEELASGAEGSGAVVVKSEPSVPEASGSHSAPLPSTTAHLQLRVGYVGGHLLPASAVPDLLVQLPPDYPRTVRGGTARFIAPQPPDANTMANHTAATTARQLLRSLVQSEWRSAYADYRYRRSGRVNDHDNGGSLSCLLKAYRQALLLAYDAWAPESDLSVNQLRDLLLLP